MDSVRAKTESATINPTPGAKARRAKPLLVAALVGVMACSRRGPELDASTDSPTTDAAAREVTTARVATDASSDSGAGTIRLLIEQVVVSNGVDGRLHPSGYDLLAVHEPVGGKPKRIQPFCPPARRNLYEMCKIFRTCKAGETAIVTCDGSAYALVQHEGATYLKTQDGEIGVRQDAPRILPPASRTRTAIVDL